MSENDTSIESRPWYKNVSAMLKLSATFLAVAGSAITLYLNLPDKPSAEMLAIGIERALPDLSGETVAIEALARLHILLGRDEQALHWIDRGLETSPMSAALTLLKRQLDPETEPKQPEAGEPIAPAPLPMTDPADTRRGDDTRSRAA